VKQHFFEQIVPHATFFLASLNAGLNHCYHKAFAERARGSACAVKKTAAEAVQYTLRNAPGVQVKL
jgi:hypothetical protein